MLWIRVFMLFFFAAVANTSPNMFQDFICLFNDCHTGSDSPELMHLGPPATSSSKVAETAEFQHCKIKFHCISTPLVQDEALVSLFGVSASPCHGSLSQHFVRHRHPSIFMAFIPEVLIPKPILEILY